MMTYCLEEVKDIYNKRHVIVSDEDEPAEPQKPTRRRRRKRS